MSNDASTTMVPPWLPQWNLAVERSDDQRQFTSLSMGAVGLFTVSYLLVIQLLRRHRQRELTNLATSRTSMSILDAQQIYDKLARLEFPMVNKLSLQFALFRTYGIPSISGLLQKTTLLSDSTTAARRYVDTTVLIYEFLGQTYGTPAWVKPLARTNAIHGHYRDTGKIREADMLYTLTLFAQQPWKWIDMYEWRTLSETELNAMGTLWRAIGEAMEIDYTGLQVPGWIEDKSAPTTPNGKGRGEWKTGADWLRCLDAWALNYEQTCMVPAESNVVVAEASILLLLDEVPKLLHPLGRQAIASLMDDRLRRAMNIPAPPKAIYYVVHAVLIMRKVFIRYLIPPRPHFLQVKTMSSLQERPTDGRGHLMGYDNFPLYVRPTLSNRWGLRAWMRRLAGKPLPGDPGTDPEGYFPDKAGPPVGRAPKEQAKRERMVQEVVKGQGCPMAFR